MKFQPVIAQGADIGGGYFVLVTLIVGSLISGVLFIFRASRVPKGKTAAGLLGFLGFLFLLAALSGAVFVFLAL